MSDNQLKQIKEKVEIPKLRLWLVWLFLFVIPSALTVVVFDSIKEEYAYFAHTELIAKSYDIIKKYNETIVPESFMKLQIEDIKKINLANSEESLKKEIDNILCGESLFSVFFDKEVKGIKYVKSNNIQKFPFPFLKNYIGKYIKAYFDKETDKDKIDEYYEAQKLFGNFLQQFFKTVTGITISRDEVAKNFSILFDGELYFIFGFFDKPNDNYYGFFIVMKGCDFSFHKMLERIHEKFPNVKLVFREIDINKVYDNPASFYSGIKKTSKGNYIIAPTDMKFARHVLHSGKVSLNEGYGKLFPFIQYYIPTEYYEEDIRKSSKIINYSALIVMLISGIYILYVSLFGFNENFQFKNKIMFLSLVSALFPFTVFSIGIYTIENFNRLITKTLVQQHAEIELQFVAQQLNKYLNEIESDVSNYANEISKKMNELSSTQFKELLNLIGDNIPLTSEVVYLKTIPVNLRDIVEGNTIVKQYTDRMSKELVNEQDQVIQLIPAVIINNANSKEGFENRSLKDRERQDILNIAGHEVMATNINEGLINDGKLILFDQFVAPTWYVLKHLIVEEDKLSSDTVVIERKKSSVEGIFALKFEPRPILDFFFSKRKKANIKFNEIKGNYNIDYAFLPIERSGSATIWEKGSKNISDSDRDLCLKSTQSGVIELEDKIIVKKRNQQVPHLAVAIITQLQKEDDRYFIIKIIVGIILYLFLILYFANRLLDIMFVEPVMLLASNASAIARGGDKWETKINSGDEFEKLNKSFKELVTGLQERNVLKSYVSEDAFSDIEESDNVKLLPGGEYLEATIVFSAIKDYDKLSSAITPQESIKLLSKFMSIAEEVTKKYGGSIDKIIGDTIMLVFRDNPKLESHGLRAAQASLELVGKAKKIGLPKLYTGIASGRVISGRIGSYSGKLDFTVIGNPVNSAARFKTESKNGTEETGIIISGTTVGLMKGRAIVKFLRRVDIKGKQRKYNIYELLGVRE